MDEIAKIPTETFDTVMGTIIVKSPIWDDYAELMGSIPEDLIEIDPKKEKKEEEERQKKALMKYIQEYILMHWILKPFDIAVKRKDPKWATSLFGVTMQLALPVARQ